MIADPSVIKVPERILVVDDDTEIRDALCAALQYEGYEVHIAVNGKEAVERAQRLKPNLILMDVQMPVIDGIEATRKLKEDPVTVHIPILMVTVLDKKENIVKALEAGAIDYVTKPFFMPELTARVKAVLTLKKHYDESIEVKKQLNISEEKYRLVVDNASEAIVVIQDGMSRFFNPKIREFMRCSRKDLASRPFVDFVHSEDQAKASEYFTELLEGEGAARIFDFRVVNKRGGIKWLEANGVLINWEGKPATLNFLTDVTERKQAQEEKETIQYQLLQAQKMEAVGTLAGGVAHDFNNLLQVIQGYGQMLLHDENQDERAHQALVRIVGAAKRGANLTQQLLTFSRAVDSDRRPLDLNHEVKKVKKLLERTIPKMINIDLDLTDNLKIVNADPTQVEQVLMNLAVNAKDAMPEGGKLLIKTENAILNDEVCRLHPDATPWVYALLTVSDSGHGMDSETQEHIFEPFYTTKDVDKGTGLGLAMVYGIVKNHNGFISCSSDPGEGTTFKIYLPTLDREVQVVDEEEAQAPIKKGSETILLVDDEELIRDLVVQVLGESGYTVITAPDGKSGLNLYGEQQAQIDLVILDLIMPEMGGRKCLEELIKMDPQARVLIASGYALDGPAIEAIKTGARGHISKPYDIKEMLRVIRAVLDHN
ncbi:MAG: response regulator [Deltaproteobacteria bacterium]|nr:response regulator [Deltaproteobacteria bacterium]